MGSKVTKLLYQKTIFVAIKAEGVYLNSVFFNTSILLSCKVQHKHRKQSNKTIFPVPSMPKEALHFRGTVTKHT